MSIHISISSALKSREEAHPRFSSLVDLPYHFHRNDCAKYQAMVISLGWISYPTLVKWKMPKRRAKLKMVFLISLTQVYCMMILIVIILIMKIMVPEIIIKRSSSYQR